MQAELTLTLVIAGGAATEGYIDFSRSRTLFNTGNVLLPQISIACSRRLTPICSSSSLFGSLISSAIQNGDADGHYT